MNDFILESSENPGSHERHLNRKYKNPLFGDKQTELDQESMLDAQKEDHEILLTFHKEFQDAVQQTVDLKPNVDSDVILKLKDSLDKLYEKAGIIADDQSESKNAITKLITVIMGSIRNGAGTDVQAHQELDQEDAARAAHFEMLSTQLVGDFLDPASAIHKDELVPTLLSADKDQLAPAIRLFDEDQLTLIVREGEDLINTLAAQQVDIRDAAENLVFIEGYIQFLNLPETD
ncbi:MAG: hypothetical protein V3U84_12110 [Thiotrichaceae bacterium]